TPRNCRIMVRGILTQRAKSQLLVVRGQWSEISGQRSVVSRQWSLEVSQSSVVSGHRRSVVSRQLSLAEVLL
ncbi:MAG TPA: hypothetical protein VIB00_05870, partial [Pyrinomonadaceae bacterium]